MGAIWRVQHQHRLKVNDKQLAVLFYSMHSTGVADADAIATIVALATIIVMASKMQFSSILKQTQLAD